MGDETKIYVPISWDRIHEDYDRRRGAIVCNDVDHALLVGYAAGCRRIFVDRLHNDEEDLAKI